MIDLGDFVNYSRREVLIGGMAAASLLATGCSHVPMLADIQSLSKYSPQSSQDQYPLSREKLNALPYASIGVQLEGAARAVMILATAKNGITTWCSAEEELLRFDGPTLVGTQGLQRDLVDTHWLSISPVSTLAAGTSVGPVHVRSLDLRTGRNWERNVEVMSSYRDEGLETIRILDTVHTCRRISETVDMRQWRWKRTNTYWIDVGQPQLLWKSVFGYAPDVPAITIETLKKYQA